MSGGRATWVGLAIVLVAGCGGGGDSHCPGGAVRRPLGAGLSREASVVEMANWNVDEGRGLIGRNTNSYRFDGAVAVIGEERVTARLSKAFTVAGCGTDGGEPGLDDLLAARFGATFVVDRESGELVRATCNGCM